MGASDIKAAGAYVELGGKDDKLVACLNAAREKVHAWSEDVAKVGAVFAGMGAAITAPIMECAKHVADFGAEISKIHEKTGASTEALSALAVAGEKYGIGMEQIGQDFKGMEKGIGSGGAGFQAALAEVGVSFEKLKGMSPDQQFGTLADALSKISDPAKESVLATQLFGRAGQALIPVLEMGTEGLNKMAEQAGKTGQLMGADAAENAMKLKESFKTLEGSLSGLQNAIGGAVAGKLTEWINKISDCAQGVMRWVDDNPKLVQSLLNIGILLATVGAAVAAFSAVIWVATMPMTILIAELLALGVVLLSVTDFLGLTDSGFSDLFDSIRIGGTGLATWFATFFMWMEKRFNDVIMGAKILGHILTGQFGAVKTDIKEHNKAESWIDQDIAKRFVSDENSHSSSPKNGIDTASGKKALEKMGGKIGEMISGVLGNFSSIGQGLAPVGAAPGDIFGPGAKGGTPGTAGVPQLSAVGTFSGRAASGLAGSGSIFERQAQAIDRIARNTDKMAEQTKSKDQFPPWQTLDWETPSRPTVWDRGNNGSQLASYLGGTI